MSDALLVLRERYREALRRQEMAWARHRHYLTGGDAISAERAFAEAQQFHDQAGRLYAELAVATGRSTAELDNPA